MTPTSRSSVGRIVAGTDGSPRGEFAVRVARELAASAGAELVVLCVVSEGGTAPPRVAPPAGVRGGAPSGTAVAERVPVEVRAGHPSIEIARCAEHCGATLLVIGRRPSAEVGQMMLGPTADQIVRRSSVPCLVVPTGAWRPAPRFLAAVDGTERGAAVPAGAARVADLCGGSIRAVTVFAELPMEGAGSMIDPAVAERVRRIAQLRTGRGRRRVDAVPGPPVLVRHGDPVDQVLLEASEGVDVIAVGVHRLGPPDSDLERGIARRILRRATGAVLTIPL